MTPRCLAQPVEAKNRGTWKPEAVCPRITHEVLSMKDTDSKLGQRPVPKQRRPPSLDPMILSFGQIGRNFNVEDRISSLAIEYVTQRTYLPFDFMDLQGVSSE